MGSLETKIENAILKNLKSLDFPDALAIRNCRLGENSGAVDLLLLPKSGRLKVVLIEAKVSRAADAASKVIGQLLMYYAGALTIGSKGWKSIRNFAEQRPKRSRNLARVSLKLLSGGVSPPDEAWRALNCGKKLSPRQIQLFVAMNGEPHKAFRLLREKLRKTHRIDIGLIIVRNGQIEIQPHEASPS